MVGPLFASICCFLGSNHVTLSLSLICVTFYHLWFGEPYNMSREMYESNEKEILLVRLLKVRARQDLSSLS